VRLLIAVDTYVPARISGALQMHDLARELAAQGHAPTVLMPANDLGKPWQLEVIDGVQVLRVRALRTKDVGLVRRALAECLLPFSLLLGLRRSPLRDQPWDGIVWYSPTIFLGFLAARIKRRSGCRGYLILRDLFPDWAVDAGVMRRGLAYRLFKAVERYQYAVADVIGVQTPANAPLVERDRRGDGRVEVLHNWLSAPPAGSSALDLSKTALAGRTVFVYTGNMGAAQGMDSLLDLAVQLRDNVAIGFLFIGRGSEQQRLQARAQREGLDGLLLVDEVPSSEIPSILDQCHVGLIALDPRHTTHNIPGKFLTYLRAGLPVLAFINHGNDLANVIEGESVGYACTNGSVEHLRMLAERIAGDPMLRSAMATRGRALWSREYSTSAAARQVLAGLGKSGRSQSPSP
jgi:glycosyltransferase involved in cell wall biosynthesis